MVEMTKISSKGQIVIPAYIREALSLEEGNRLVIERVDNLIILKKVKVNDLKEEFERLTRKGAKVASKMGIKNEEDVVRLIHKRRGVKSD